MKLRENIEENQADYLARYLPDGEAWKSKWIEGSNLRNLLIGLGKEFSNIEQRNSWLRRELNIYSTEDLIEYWEKDYGIPDNIFSITGKTIKERQTNLIIKEMMNGADKAPDWEYIAKQFGFDVKVYPGTDKTRFTYTFPIIFADYPKYTIIVDMLGISPTDPSINLLKSVFETIKPIDCVIIYI